MRAVTAAVLRAAGASAGAASQANAGAERAMGGRRKAIAPGYKEVGRLKKDVDLEALRDRQDFEGLLAGVEAGKVKETPSSAFPPAAGVNDSLRLVNKPHFSCAVYARLSQGVTARKPNITRGLRRGPPAPQGAPQEKQRRACAGRFEFRYQRRRPAMPFLEKPN